MPRGNGRGPLRLRLRGRGMRRGNRVSEKSSIGRSLLGFGIPIAGALIDDMRNPDGYLQTFLHKLMHRKTEINVIDVKATPIEQKRDLIEKK